MLLLLMCMLPVGCKDDAEPSAGRQGLSVRREFTEGPLGVRVELSNDQILLSELVSMQITAVVDSGYEVEFPEMEEALRDFRIHDWEDGGKKLLAEGKIQIHKRYCLEPMQTGEMEIPPLEFQFYKHADGDTQAERSILTTEGVPVTVATILQGDLAEVIIADIEEVVEMKAGFSWLWISAITVLAAGAIVTAVLLLRPKKAAQFRKIYRPAHEIALEWIRKLAGQRLIEQGRVKEFYERLSNCLRHYIEDRFSLRAPEQTTEEFLEEIKNSPVLRANHKEELKKFLEHCDRVKFAKFQPTQQQNDQSLQMVEQFILNTKSDERLVEAGQNGEGM